MDASQPPGVQPYRLTCSSMHRTGTPAEIRTAWLSLVYTTYLQIKALLHASPGFDRPHCGRDGRRDSPRIFRVYQALVPTRANPVSPNTSSADLICVL